VIASAALLLSDTPITAWLEGQLRLSTARERIARTTHLNAFITLLGGEPERHEVVAVKDSVDVAGIVTTVGCAAQDPLPAAVDAPLVSQIREHGGAIVGKTNMHEWALGLTSANRHFGDVRNPHDPSRVAGGSSGGSAAAVAAELCDWAVGGDTGGSIIVPAALCGVVGYKPTFGLVDTTGTSPVSQSLDTMGALASRVTIAAHAVEMMTGLTSLQPTAVPDFTSLRVAVPENWVSTLDSTYRPVWQAIAGQLPSTILPTRAEMHRASEMISLAEAARNHSRWFGSVARSDRYPDDVWARLQIGKALSEEDYRATLERSRRFRSAVDSALQDFDVLMVPATHCVAPLIGQTPAAELSYYCKPFNATGHPTIAVPVPTNGLPTGLLLVGRRDGDADLLAAAAGLERHLQNVFTGTDSPL
jgi:aspartyl-tRNA(Asn)/glutamyl-tRNA(Gln) amidotransferase subunit A